MWRSAFVPVVLLRFLKRFTSGRHPPFCIILTQYYILVKLFYCYFIHFLSDKLYVSSLVTACRCFYIYEVLILSNLKAQL